MILNTAEAQSLLVRLVQALSPLMTVREIAPSLFLMRRFLIPSFYSQEESLVDRHQIKVLNTLHAMQKEIGEWVGETADLVPKQSIPLTRQARELVHQVQGAIAKLSSSTQIRAPQEEVLLKTLKDLKPKLDRIVETLITLPGAPHTPEPKRLILSDKKKKRKGLWFQKEEDSHRDP